MTTVVNRYPNAEALAQDAAEQFVLRLIELLNQKTTVHVMLTGGTIGIATLAAAADVEQIAGIDFSKVHFWWGDERFVESDSNDRNAVQARRALLSKISVPEQNIHEFPASDQGLSLDEAAESFAQTFNSLAPEFDVAFVGMGPDGHVCSLFPGRNQPAVLGAVVVESNSPKPPAQRLSFGFEVMNRVSELWFVVAGADKSDAVASVFSDDKDQLPAAQVHGLAKTIWFVDQTAGVKTWGC